MELKIVSFNLRCDVECDGELRFLNRRAAITREISRRAPDSIGFQEMLPPMRDYLEEALPQYEFVGVEREADYSGECSAVAFLKARFRLHETRTFWLSPTPDAPGSRYPEQSPCPRVCTLALLRDKATGELFTHLNTHLDHWETAARDKGLAQTLAAPGPRAVVTGDFNFTPDYAAYGQIAAAGYRDLSAASGGTFHDYERRAPIKIDYILTNAPCALYSLSLWHKSESGMLLSDHDAVEADFSI